MIARQILLISAVTLLVAAVSARAQSGSMSGKVTGGDRGGPLPGAVVGLDALGLRVAEGRTKSNRELPDHRHSDWQLHRPGPQLRIHSPGLPEHDHFFRRSAYGQRHPRGGADAARGRFGHHCLEGRRKADRGPGGGLRAASAGDRGAPGAHRRRSPQEHSGRRRRAGRPGPVQRGRPRLQQHFLRRAAHPDRLPVRGGARRFACNVATFFPTTNEDIEKIEFVLGPGAALYGPNSANGVLNIITRSPFTSTGTTLTLEGGVRAGSTGAGLQRRQLQQPHVSLARRHRRALADHRAACDEARVQGGLQGLGELPEGDRVARAGCRRSPRISTR